MIPGGPWLRPASGPSCLPGLGDLPALLDPGGALVLLTEAGLDVTDVQTTYLRLKPGGGALVGVTIHHRGGSLPGYVRTGSRRRCAEVAAKWSRLRVPDTPLGRAVLVHPGGHSLICLFPADAALRQLPVVVGPDTLKRHLATLPTLRHAGRRVSGRASQLHPLRYKPERRFVARLDTRLRADGERAEQTAWIVRYLGGQRGRRTAAAASALYRAGAPVPEPLGVLMGGQLLVEGRIPGRELAESLPGDGASAQALAGALRRFHRCGASLDAVMTPADLLVRAQRSLAVLTGVLPAEAGRARALLNGLYRAAPDRAPLGPTHGDLHLHQVIVGPAGPVLVDLERAAMGDPLHDVGSLLAHMKAVAGASSARRASDFGEELVDAVLRDGAGSPSRLAFHVAAGLVEQALLAFRQLQPAWSERVATLLAQADEELKPRERTAVRP